MFRTPKEKTEEEETQKEKLIKIDYWIIYQQTSIKTYYTELLITMNPLHSSNPLKLSSNQINYVKREEAKIFLKQYDLETKYWKKYELEQKNKRMESYIDFCLEEWCDKMLSINKKVKITKELKREKKLQIRKQIKH